jgi:cytochrome c biogenesis protein CcdA
MLEALLVGLFVGLQHALEIDHVAAVTSMMSGQKSRLSIVKHGVAWGIGHATTLLAVTLVIVATGQAINDSVAEWLEFAVGLMLVGLGIHVLWRMRRDRIHIHAHRHGDLQLHLHFHSHARDAAPHLESMHRHDHIRLPLRSMAIGTMHGMAGSAALIAVVAASFGNFTSALVYVAIFGLGSIAGMALLSAIMSVPLAWSARTMTITNVVAQSAIGILTISVGLVLAYETKLHLLVAT